jgi:peptidyl-tRNA hydrolase
MPERNVGDVRDFVLSRVAKADRVLLDQTEEIATKAVEALIGEGIERAMAAFNGVDVAAGGRASPIGRSHQEKEEKEN